MTPFKHLVNVFRFNKSDEMTSSRFSVMQLAPAITIFMGMSSHNVLWPNMMSF